MLPSRRRDRAFHLTLGKGFYVLFILFAMLAILAVAGLVVVYAAFPHRGADVPHALWLGEGMQRAVDLVPTLDEDGLESRG